MNADKWAVFLTSVMNVFFRLRIFLILLWLFEGKYKYDQEVYDLFMESFDLIPLACVVNGKFLALHGGISPELKTLEDVKRLDRFHEPPKQGLFW